MYVYVKTTSSAEKGEPSEYLTPCLSFHVTVVRSAETPPLATVGISAARRRTGAPLLSNAASGSRMTRDASESLVPVDWWPLRIVGACQYKIGRASCRERV